MRRSCPPLIEIDQCVRILRHGQDQLAGFFRLVVHAQPLHARENVTGIAARIHRHRVEQRLGVVEPLDHRGAGAADRQIVAAEPARRAHTGFDVAGIEALLHPHLVVGAREQIAEHLEHLALGFGAAFVVTPGVTHQRGRAVAIASGEENAGEHEAALGGARLVAGEESDYRGVVDMVVPQRVLRAAAEQRCVRPGRVAGDERRVTREARIGVVAAQDHPFRELAGDRILDAGFVRVGFAKRPLRAASITRFTAAISSGEVETEGAIAN